MVEWEDSQLIFTNLGEFLPGSIESIIESEDPPAYYRNNFLAQAMVNLNMIDTVGSGIKRMFRAQRARFFPMPDYDFTGNRVKATLTGKVLDVDFARILALNPDLTLEEIITLDKIQKKKDVEDDEVRTLKKKGLIEGRKPNYHLSSGVAARTDQKAEYIKNRGFKDQHYKDLILEFIDKYGQATREDINKLILDILPNVLDADQKSNKVKNIIYAMASNEKTIKKQGNTKSAIWVRNV